ncbi:MAG: HAD family hydrolase [Alphaproteobacteria bacterium]|nr:HAD family hydrolase [Alphaproteobacteria bacterium]
MTRLVLFDCDGTLVDSLHVIVGAMQAAWRQTGLAPPDAAAIRATVGLSPHQAIAALGGDAALADSLIAVYRAHYLDLQQRPEGVQPLYPGIRAALQDLAQAGHLLGVATGKSRRGLTALLRRHDIDELFVTLQTADDAPSKPHPGMVERALAETGFRAEAAIMVGDTTFDMEMARAAGVEAVGVAWGYHDRDRLLASGARCVVESAADLVPAIGPGLRQGQQ